MSTSSAFIMREINKGIVLGTLFVAGCGLLVARGAYTEPVLGPAQVQAVEPLNIGSLPQNKQGYLGADDFWIENYTNYRLVIKDVPITDADGIPTGATYRGGGIETTRGTYLSSVLNKAGEARHYHAEIGRPNGKTCEWLDLDSNLDCPSSYTPNGTEENRMLALRADIVRDFCGDSDGCDVVLARKDYDPLQKPGIVWSIGPYRFFDPGAGFYWRVTDPVRVVEGVDDDDLVGDILVNSGCRFMDADFGITFPPPLATTTFEDNAPGYGLWNGEANLRSICVIDIWD